jgi:hypothetical protein
MENIQELIAVRLKEEMLEGSRAMSGAPLSKELAKVIGDCCLTWLPLPQETMALSSPRQVVGIVGFAFGNRFEAHGNRSAGPVNEKLSKLVVDYYNALRKHGIIAHVWVQWEIGHYIKDSDIAPSDITRVEPVPDIERDTVEYVSTIKFFKEVNSALPDKGKTPAEFLVIAQPDQLRRCMRIVKKFKHRPVAVQHENPDDPSWYDLKSSQLWTRTRHLYLLHDMIGQLSLQREEANLTAKDVGIW